MTETHDTNDAQVETAAAAAAQMIRFYAEVRGMDAEAVKVAVIDDRQLFDLSMKWADVPSQVERIAESVAQAQGTDSGTLLMANAAGALTAAREGRHVMATAMMTRIHELATQA